MCTKARNLKNDWREQMFSRKPEPPTIQAILKKLATSYERRIHEHINSLAQIPYISTEKGTTKKPHSNSNSRISLIKEQNL